MVNTLYHLCKIRCVSILVAMGMYITSFLIELSLATLVRICTLASMHKICCEYD